MFAGDEQQRLSRSRAEMEWKGGQTWPRFQNRQPAKFAESRAARGVSKRTLTSWEDVIRTIPAMSTPKSRTSKPGNESGNDKDICGATNRNGNPCKLPAGWGTPGSGGTRCKYHGGLSTGPDDTSHLENNDYAEGNPGGRPPENNDNAAIHGGFSDWRTAYKRFQTDPDARERIEKLESAYLETASEHAADLERDRRERLARELATRRVLKQRAQEDVWNDGENSAKSGRNNDTDADADARGLLIEDGDGGRTVNPAHIAAHQHKQRTREIAQELSLWSGFQ